MAIKFDKDLLAVEQNNYLTKMVSFYIVYELDVWPRNPTTNVQFKSCLFGATNVLWKVAKKSGYILAMQ